MCLSPVDHHGAAMRRRVVPSPPTSPGVEFLSSAPVRNSAGTAACGQAVRMVAVGTGEQADRCAHSLRRSTRQCEPSAGRSRHKLGRQRVSPNQRASGPVPCRQRRRVRSASARGAVRPAAASAWTTALQRSATRSTRVRMRAATHAAGDERAHRMADDDSPARGRDRRGQAHSLVDEVGRLGAAAAAAELAMAEHVDGDHPVRRRERGRSAAAQARAGARRRG